MTELHEDFRSFVLEHGPHMLRYVYRYSKNLWDAEDATQTTLEKFWRRWDEEDFRKSAKNNPGFGKRAALNTYRDAVRSEASDRGRQHKTRTGEVFEESEYSRVEGDEDFARAMEVLASLNPTWCTVIVMRYQYEKSVGEVAAALGISDATARRYEKGALKALKEADKRM